MSATLLAAITVAVSAPMPCEASASASQALVRGFYTTALIERKVREGFERDVAPGFIEHKPDIVSADRAGAMIFLENLIAELPLARWELLRVTGEPNW